jgi:hypothetical protein
MKYCRLIIPVLLLWIFAVGTNAAFSQTLPTVQFARTAAEGPESTTSVAVGVVLSEPSTAVVGIEYRVTGGTATTGEDFILLDGSVTFQPGETVKTIPLVIIDDLIEEDDETIVITLSNPANAVLGKNTTYTYTILDNDTVSVSFTSETSSEVEALSPHTLEVKLSKAAQQTVTVNYTVSGTALGNGIDYTLPDGILTFKPGETSQKIVIDINDNSIQEPDRTVIITLTKPANAKLGKIDSHTHWILDDDGPQENIYLYKQEVETADAGRKLIIVGPKALTVNPRGLALDKFGNMYISDQGPNRGEGEGSILMWPKGKRRVIRIITGLTLPSDLELSPDQKVLIIAGPKGDINRIPLGLSLGLANTNAFAGVARVHLFGQTFGEKVARISADGYFHFPGILVQGQSKELYADIEINGQTKRFNLTLGQPGDSGEPYGHTVIDLNF